MSDNSQNENQNLADPETGLIRDVNPLEREIITFNDVSLEYPTIKALSNISYHIKKGEIFCLVGPNGSGKTTTIKLLTGQLSPSGGDVRVNGLDPNKNRKDLIGTFGLVPQDIALYMELTGRENLRFHGQLFRMDPMLLEARIDEMLKISGLEKRQHEKVENYSGGMKRRLQLVRALIHDPPILLLDEPSLGVDVQSRNAINQYILKIAEMGKTVILTTNYMEEAEKLADRLVILDNRIVAGPSPIQEIQEATLSGTMLGFGVTTNSLSPDQIDVLAKKLDGEVIGRNENDKLEIQIQSKFQSQQALSIFMTYCQELDISVLELNVKKPSLEDVFLHLTGREFRDE